LKSKLEAETREGRDRDKLQQLKFYLSKMLSESLVGFVKVCVTLKLAHLGKIFVGLHVCFFPHSLLSPTSWRNACFPGMVSHQSMQLTPHFLQCICFLMKFEMMTSTMDPENKVYWDYSLAVRRGRRQAWVQAVGVGMTSELNRSAINYQQLCG
jgi:hypothetical protein